MNLKRSIATIVFIASILFGYASVQFAQTKETKIKVNSYNMIFDGSDASAEDIAVVMLDNDLADEVIYNPVTKTIEFIVNGKSKGIYSSLTLVTLKVTDNKIQVAVYDKTNYQFWD